jgi:hypothetical protein
MRRKDKYIFNGAVIAAGVVVVADVFLQLAEAKENGTRLSLQNYNYQRTLKRAAVGGLIGGLVGYTCYRYEVGKEESLPFNSNRYLQKVLSEEYLRNDPIYFETLLSKREAIRNWIIQEFRDELAGYPEYGGSLSKGTAIGSIYDADIIIPFKKFSYYSLQSMFESVYKTVCRKFGRHARIEKGTKAIELTFDNNGNDISIDLVPGREINNYRIEKKLNLYVRPDWSWQSGTSFMANIRHQKNFGSKSYQTKPVVKLLKIYKTRNDISLSNVVIEQGVVEALSSQNFGYDPSETENLLNCMDFISDKLQKKTFYDFANTNNNLNDKLTYNERHYIADLLQKDVQKIEQNPRYLREVFKQ